MRFLNGSSIQKENFIEWYFHVKKIAEQEPAVFAELISEFPNPHFRIIQDVKVAAL